MSEDEAPELRRAPAERAAAAVLPACGIAWTSAQIMHWLAVPGGTGLAAATVVAASLAFGASGRWAKIPRWTAWAIAGAGGWMSLAAAEGPLHGWPYAPLTWAWTAAAVVAWRLARQHPAVLEAREWRYQRAEWLGKSSRWGLRGSHLLDFERTRLGERFEADVRGTGKRASQIEASGIAELIAEDENLPVSRVRVVRHRLAGRVSISVRYADPWANPVFHPVAGDDPEIDLPDPCGIAGPVPIGQDPETGRILDVPLWGDAGGRNVSIVAIKGAGKTVVLDDLSERVTAAADALQVRVNLSVKGPAEAERWGPSCHLTAFGPHQKGRAGRVLAAVNRVIEWRAARYATSQYDPSPSDPLIVVIIDEADSAMAVPAVRKEADDIATKGREYGVVMIRAGQRGTTDYASAKTRSQDDVFLIGKVNRQGEAYHAAGSMGFSLPDMATYGDGREGVWAVAELGGGHRLGRSWILGATRAEQGAAVARIARERAFAQPELHPDCREFLGESYEILLSTDVFAKWARKDNPATPPAPRPPAAGNLVPSPSPVATLADGDLSHLDFDMELDDDTRARLAEIDAKNAATRRVIEETRAMPAPPEASPEALAASTAERWRQVGEQAQIPGEGRARLLELLRKGTTIAEVDETFGIGRWTARTWLERMKQEGIARVDGKGRGSRFRLTEDGDGS